MNVKTLYDRTKKYKKEILKGKNMKFKIYHKILKEKVRNIVPKPYHGELPSNLKEDCYSLIIFAGPKDDVIISSTVNKALSTFTKEQSEKKLAFGECFTIETNDLFKQHGVTYFILRDYVNWADEDFKDIKNSIN